MAINASIYAYREQAVDGGSGWTVILEGWLRAVIPWVAGGIT
jgi:hypothetical protein